jgi:crotonobetaine/carnitine-CoA ligase
MYDKLRDHQHWVLPEVMACQARVRGVQIFVAMTDGDSLTYAQAEADANRVAGFLAGLGIQPGDMVAVMLPNTLDYVRVWLGLGRLGAVLVALNTGLKDAFLQHQLSNCGARVAIVHSEFLPALDEIASQLPELHTVVVAGNGGSAGPVAFDEWHSAAPYAGPLPLFKDIACVIYTSGTTGPSKGVLMPHAHCYLFGLGEIENHGMTEHDRFYIAMPLFHANGLYLQLYATMIAGCSAVMRTRFSAGAWLADVRRYGVTITNMLGAMSAFVFATPPSEADRDHHLRIVHSAPNTPEHERIWRERFGVPEVASGFGMTEVNICCYSMRGASRPGTCGVVYERYFEVEIRDPETDQPLPRGQVGEIMVRPRVPFGFMAGYYRMPEKTVESWRNFWFHTGDAAVMDEEGYVTFLDRIKDCIRRRGENISSFEVERAMGQLEGVAEVAAFAVPAEFPGGEDEVMLAIVPEAGVRLEIEALVRHAERVLPAFAQPRYISIVDALPKTPTAKVQKAKLREQGVTASTWDREAKRAA